MKSVTLITLFLMGCASTYDPPLPTERPLALQLADLEDEIAYESEQSPPDEARLELLYSARADLRIQRAAELVDGWFGEIGEDEPESEPAQALFAWTFRYYGRIKQGMNHEQARKATQHEIDVFADVVEVEHGRAMAAAAVGSVLVQLEGN